ncbi:Amino-acid N-acetyltransferase/Acetylglutamate kinase [Chlorociboria aeruginascens]|nr:Amino-acid N-acetyltransferase/Acetylglutamate kinase [Chlorociboria aeruginascens]
MILQNTALKKGTKLAGHNMSQSLSGKKSFGTTSAAGNWSKEESAKENVKDLSGQQKAKKQAKSLERQPERAAKPLAGAPLHVALVKIRDPQHLDDDTLNGIGKTLTQLERLGLISVIVVDCNEGTTSVTERQNWRMIATKQATRITTAIDANGEPGARFLDSVIGVSENPGETETSAYLQGRTHIVFRDLLMNPLRRGIIPVIPSVGYTDNNPSAIPLTANDVILALTRELAGFRAAPFPDEDPVAIRERLQALRNEVSLDRLIVLDPLGGIPSFDRPNGYHVFLNMEQEFESAKHDLLTSTQNSKHENLPQVQRNDKQVSDLGQSNPFSKFVESELASPSAHKGSSFPENPEQSSNSGNKNHLANLLLVRKVLMMLPPSSSALLTTPAEAANSGKRPNTPFQAVGVGTRRQRNPLIHNLLTDKPAFSSSLPIGRLGSSTSAMKSHPSSPTVTMTPTTFAKHGMSVTIFPDPKLTPWKPPIAGEPFLTLTDSQIDLPRLVHLIEDSFNRKLDVEDYLKRVNGRIAGVIIAGEYEGGALLTWETPPGVLDDGSPESRARMVPYLDKFAVLKRSQGSGGVADIVFKSMTAKANLGDAFRLLHIRRTNLDTPSRHSDHTSYFIIKSAIMDKVSAFGKNFSASFTPFAARTQQYVKEQLGQAEDKTELPTEYLVLEKRVDALKQVHQLILRTTAQYNTESYDYPNNIAESTRDLGRTISEKVQLLSSATSPAEAQAALTAPPSAKPQPKTFSHAIARASLASSHLLQQQNSEAGEDPLATALEKYALASERVGEARLVQDSQIQSRFLAGWNTTLNTSLMFATRARKSVENSRLLLDAAKAKSKNQGWKLPGQGGRAESHHDEAASEEARAEIEQAEDEFVGQTEEAVGVMKNVLDTPEPLRNLADLIAAQLEYHKKAYEILSELAPVVDGLQVDQESMISFSDWGVLPGDPRFFFFNEEWRFILISGADRLRTGLFISLLLWRRFLGYYSNDFIKFLVDSVKPRSDDWQAIEAWTGILNHVLPFSESFTTIPSHDLGGTHNARYTIHRTPRTPYSPSVKTYRFAIEIRPSWLEDNEDAWEDAKEDVQISMRNMRARNEVKREKVTIYGAVAIGRLVKLWILDAEKGALIDAAGEGSKPFDVRRQARTVQNFLAHCKPKETDLER